MSYFKVFSILWGLAMIGIRLLMHIIPKKWNDFELNRVYKEKKPTWVWVVGFFSVVIVALTWYKELTTDISYSLILTILVTITLLKVSQILFNYTNFRNFVIKALVEDRSIIKRINISTTIIGIILIMLGVFLY